MFGQPGRISGIVVRAFRCIFAAASAGLMVSSSKFDATQAFRAFCPVMMLESVWSFATLFCVDFLDTRLTRGLPLPRARLIVICLCDWILGFACFAVACGSASAVDILQKANICNRRHMACHKYAIASALAFLSSIFIAISAIVMFRLVALSFVSNS